MSKVLSQQFSKLLVNIYIFYFLFCIICVSIVRFKICINISNHSFLDCAVCCDVRTLQKVFGTTFFLPETTIFLSNTVE